MSQVRVSQQCFGQLVRTSNKGTEEINLVAKHILPHKVAGELTALMPGFSHDVANARKTMGL